MGNRRSSVAWRLGTLMLVALTCAGCTLPDDPNESLQTGRTDALLVGISDDPPWSQTQPMRGVEVELLTAWADENDVTLEWHPGSSEDLLRTLAGDGLDIVIGGITDDTPWTRQVSATRPFVEVDVVLTVGAGAEPPASDIGGRKVAHPVDEIALAGYIEKSGGTPVALAGPRGSEDPVALYDYQARARGRSMAGDPLHTERHVWMVEQGENRLIASLERYLHRRRDEIPGMLEQEERSR